MVAVTPLRELIRLRLHRAHWRNVAGETVSQCRGMARGLWRGWPGIRGAARSDGCFGKAVMGVGIAQEIWGGVGPKVRLLSCVGGFPGWRWHTTVDAFQSEILRTRTKLRVHWRVLRSWAVLPPAWRRRRCTRCGRARLVCASRLTASRCAVCCGIARSRTVIKSRLLPSSTTII